MSDSSRPNTPSQSYNNNNSSHYNSNSKPASPHTSHNNLSRNFSEDSHNDSVNDLVHKTVTVLTNALGRKKQYTFTTQDEFDEFLAKNHLRGLKLIKPNPSPSCISDVKELLDNGIYTKVSYSYLDQKLGLSDAGYRGVKYTVDELVPPLFNFFDELNTTIRTSILNDSAYKLSAVASELLDNTILRIKPSWTVTIDLIVLLCGLYELHCSLATLRTDPFNIINLGIIAACAYGIFHVGSKHYDVEDSENGAKRVDEEYVSRPYYHQRTHRHHESDTRNMGPVVPPTSK